MPMRKFILLVVALLIAGGTAMLARSMMTGAPAATGPDGRAVVTTETTEVLVAARDLPSGTLLKDGDLKWRVWPAEGAAEGFVVKGKTEMSEYTGGIVRQGLRTGEPILSGRVTKAHDQSFMAAVLAPGMRAVSVSITPVGGVAGFVFPGDHVDVIITHQVNRKTDTEPNGHKVSETMLTNVRVLALDQKSNDQVTEPKVAQTATLEVTPKQAETLALVTEIGTLSLALRSIANSAEPPALDPAALAAAPQGADQDSMTWDSDVSRVLTRPGNRNGSVQRIQVMRGKETTESVFDVPQ